MINQQRLLKRQEVLLRKERRMLLVFTLTSFVGTLGLLYITAHAGATSEGYQRSQLRDAIKAEEDEQLHLQKELRQLAGGSAIANAAADLNLVQTQDGIHYFPSQPEKGR